MRKTLTPTTKRVNDVLQKLAEAYDEELGEDEDDDFARTYVSYLDEQPDSYHEELFEWQDNWRDDFR